MASYAIPILTIKSGSNRYKTKLKKSSDDKQIYPSLEEEKKRHIGSSLMYDGKSSILYFKIPDTSSAIPRYTTLQCSDITAADLRVTSKYGSWDTITCRLIVECRNPLVVWKVLEDAAKKDNENQTYMAITQESCMVKATFDVSYATDLKNLLHNLKLIKLAERLHIKEQHRKGLDKHLPVPSKIREGLPDWVNYIPAKWYSCTVRLVLEYLIVIYTILTLCWAVWQLHKHVAFIRRYLQPLLDFVEYYLHLLKNWFRWLDSVAEMLSKYWWAYMKPIYLLASPIYLVLAQLFKPLGNIAGLISVVFEPIVRFVKTIGTILKPLFQPAIYICKALGHSFKQFWCIISETSIIRMLINKFNQVGAMQVFNEILHGSLDPIRAQMVVIRDICYKSARSLIYGLRFIFTRIQYTHMFIKRERQYVKEGHVLVKDEEKDKDD